MRLVSRLFSFAAASCLVASVAVAEPNPLYKSWSGQTVGTSTVVKGSSEMMGQTTEMELVTTLLELTPEKAVVEMKASATVMGQKMDQPAMKQDIPATATDQQPADPIAAAKKMGAEVKELPDEKVTVSGKEYNCKVFESTMKQGEMTMSGKTWVSYECPGMLVKTETSTSGQMAGKQKMELTAINAK